MDEVKKMIRTVINGQSALKQELVKEIKKTNEKVGLLRNDIKDGFRKVNKRLDVIGKSVAFLEDDTPTLEEHDKLEKRVTRVEKKLHIQPTA